MNLLRNGIMPQHIIATRLKIHGEACTKEFDMKMALATINPGLESREV
tara:strand:+ start:3269 stop:3412 length:144 start_codon:yes stop_codon:yes gene_type:complete